MSTGCAAVFKGSTQDVEFISTPEKADVRVDSRYFGATPVRGELNRNASQHVVISKEGFGEQRVTVQRHPDTPWWFWDIATCAVPVMLCIPLLVDAISGAWFSLDDDVRVKLDPIQVARPLAPSSAPPAAPPTTLPPVGPPPVGEPSTPVGF